MIDALKAEIMAVIDERKLGIMPEEEESSTRYKPMIPLTAVR
jgi:hypothetical protein